MTHYTTCSFYRTHSTWAQIVEPSRDYCTTNMTRVLVTGASGYLAMHVVKQLLDSEEYIVRGTVRSLANEEKVKPLRSLCPENAKYELELAEADLTKKESWIEWVSVYRYVVVHFVLKYFIIQIWQPHSMIRNNYNRLYVTPTNRPTRTKLPRSYNQSYCVKKCLIMPKLGNWNAKFIDRTEKKTAVIRCLRAGGNFVPRKTNLIKFPLCLEQHFHHLQRFNPHDCLITNLKVTI